MQHYTSTGAIKARVIADNVTGCVEALITGHCDLMLAYSSAALPTLAQMNRYPSAPLPSERLVPVSAQKGGRSARYTLSGRNLLPDLCYPSNSCLGRLTASMIEREHLAGRLDFRYECSISDVLKSGVLASAGIAWIPELAVRDELAAGSLV